MCPSTVLLQSNSEMKRVNKMLLHVLCSASVQYYLNNRRLILSFASYNKKKVSPFLDISSGVSPLRKLTPYRSMALTKLTESVSKVASEAASRD